MRPRTSRFWRWSRSFSLLVLGGCLPAFELGARAQGTILFNTSAVGCRVWNSHTGEALEGSRFRGQLYVGAVSNMWTFRAVGGSEPFRTGAGAGYISGPDVAVEAAPPGSGLFVQLKVWDGDAGSSYEAAMAAGGLVGDSEIIWVSPLGGGSATPARLDGLGSFVIGLQREPYAWASLDRGASGLVLRWQSDGPGWWGFKVLRATDPGGPWSDWVEATPGGVPVPVEGLSGYFRVVARWPD